ncbi:hypothetical protein EJ377_00415 [Chryseobacterium arthrosphaerae]|uniref:Uncharacterized protein n=1 Tax=Chryseobacterium arthrosphaerae TaxID=651561 RepID=A0A3S0N4Y3_9FLAO|nr:hypothetical protein EJ377_00415 [Chryseobacterium arthrosphaerae]
MLIGASESEIMVTISISINQCLLILMRNNLVSKEGISGYPVKAIFITRRQNEVILELLRSMGMQIPVSSPTWALYSMV